MPETFTTRQTMYANQAQQARGQQRESQTGSYASGAAASVQGQADMAALMNQFSQINMGGNMAGNVPAAGTALPAGHAQGAVGSPYFVTPDGRTVYTLPLGAYPGGLAAPMAQMSDNNYAAFQALQQLPHQSAYPGYLAAGYPLMPYGVPGFYADKHDLHKEVPGLENRRGSYSTIESTPGTPFYGAADGRDHGMNIAAMRGSPLYSTPSPQQLSAAVLAQQIQKPLPYKLTISEAELDALLQQAPAIPRAVPAVFTPSANLRTLEQSMNNPIFGNRNVYIRGLHPNTDDETLAAYAARFGAVETSKAIIDTQTGACKGFGFSKYFDVRHSELCIRGFYKLGYEVGFARESFNSRLKAEGDESSTNLYVSNLPKDFGEQELGAIFEDYTVKSSKILRDDHGKSRGVGFARFESREICEEIIRKFHGVPIGDEGLLLQVRYADTPAQKDLKRVTTERRQFRTNEYNVGAYGNPELLLSPILTSPVLPRMAQIVRHIPSRANGSWKREVSASSTNGSASTVTFKDIEKHPKVSQLPVESSKTSVKYIIRIECDSGDDGATIVPGTSPAVATSPATQNI